LQETIHHTIISNKSTDLIKHRQKSCLILGRSESSKTLRFNKSEFENQEHEYFIGVLIKLKGKNYTKYWKI